MTPEEIERLPYRPCVGVMLVNRDGLIFVGQRIDRDQDAWQMPQGGVDEAEDPRAAVLRELREETGIAPGLVDVEAESESWLHYDLPHELVPRIWKGRYRGQKQKWYLLRFRGADDQIDIETDHPEFSAWQWLSPGDLVANIVPFKRRVYEQVMELFKEHL